MPKYAKQEEPQQKQWTPSMKEADILSEKLKGFEKTQIQKYTYYPIHMLMLKEGIIGTDEKYGAIMVRSPERYKQTMDTYDLMRWKQDKDAESLYQAFPEERVAAEVRIELIRQDVRNIFTNAKRGISEMTGAIGSMI